MLAFTSVYRVFEKPVVYSPGRIVGLVTGHNRGARSVADISTVPVVRTSEVVANELRESQATGSTGSRPGTQCIVQGIVGIGCIPTSSGIQSRVGDVSSALGILPRRWGRVYRYAQVLYSKGRSGRWLRRGSLDTARVRNSSHADRVKERDRRSEDDRTHFWIQL